MNLLPYERLTYQTPLTPEEIEEALQDIVEPVKIFRFNLFSHHKKYEGEVTRESFKMSKVPQGRNASFARAIGSITQKEKNTYVEVCIDMPLSIRFFAFFWFSLLITVGVIIDNNGIPDKSSNFILLYPWTLILFGVVFFLGTFKWQASRLKRDLQEVLEAEILPTQPQSTL